MVKVSVIIPTYNYGRYLLSAFQSVFADVRDMEIIIVNDASTDNTESIVNEICRPFRYPMQVVHYYRFKENRGVSAVRNFGLAKSKGQYITFLDADDMRTPGSIWLQSKYLDEHKSVDVVFGKAVEIRGDIDYKDALPLIRTGRLHPAEVNPQTVMYRREVFKKYGGWYEGLRSGEDKEMSMRLGVHPESPFSFVKTKKIKKYPIAFYRKHSLEKHKLRKANPNWAAEVNKVQTQRMLQLKKEGVTEGNTCFPIGGRNDVVT